MKAHHHKQKLMGCRFVLTAIHKCADTAWNAIRAGESEIRRIESLISSWKSSSQTNRINDSAGVKPEKVDVELFELIERSLKISEMTAGAFDISGNLSRHYWDFNQQELIHLHDEKVAELRSRIDYRNILVDRESESVFLSKPGMKIGFGGIGKGYAAYRAKVVMKSCGVDSGLIDASGDIFCWGDPPNRKGWEVKVADPNDTNRAIITVQIPEGAVVTSGSYEKYFTLNGTRYSHIVDPRSGLPLKGTCSVTVISPNPEFGDAMATAISVLGPNEGLNLVNRLNGIECAIIDQNGEHFLSENLSSLKA